MTDSTDTLSSDFVADGEEQHWLWRIPQTLIQRWRPRKGWIAFFLMLWLQLLFILSLRNTNWADFATAHLPPEVLPLASLLFIWFIARPNPRPAPAKSVQARFGWGLALTAVGLLLWLQQMTNLLGRWLQWSPERGIGLNQWFRDVAIFLAHVSQDSVLNLATRFEFWLQGVRGSGAQQDDLIFIGLISLVIFILTSQACWMFLAGYSILVTMVPSLWLYALMLFYSRGPRLELVLYLALLFALWAWSHHQKLADEWNTRSVDFPESLGLDRAMSVLVALVTMAVFALTLPSIRVNALWDWANDLLNPVDQATVDLGQRMFPELQSKFHGRRQSADGGLPNSFLLGNAPELSTQVALVVDTNFPLAEEQGFYLRGMIFQHYDGKGWFNDPAVAPLVVSANEMVNAPLYPHTREVWQFVEVRNASSVIYAIPEPVQFSVKVRQIQDHEHGQVIMYRNAERNTYSVLSSMPLLSDSILAAVPLEAYGTLNETDLLAPFLQVPATVTERTRQLALELTQDHGTPYAKAMAVEQYLRTLPYDLEVSLPGPHVTDLADHFLFELQRGYCDYYATAFVVLMRLIGLPTRFVVGYAPGYFEPYVEQWIITDAQAHSWPEVWMPTLGWIPFEPTAGRREMERGYEPVEFDLPSAVDAAGNASQDPGRTTTLPLNPQMWFWVLLVLAGGGTALFWRLQTYHDPDPWEALLRWGHRLGKPKRVWQTEREYAGELEATLQTRPRLAAEEQRVLAGYLNRLTEDIVVEKYAIPTPGSRRDFAIRENWTKLRARFWRIWVFRL